MAAMSRPPAEKRGNLYGRLKELPDGRFQCPDCSFASATKNGIRGHYQAHRRIKNRKCHDCGKVFENMSVLMIHKMKKHGTRYKQPAPRYASVLSTASQDHPLHRGAKRGGTPTLGTPTRPVPRFFAPQDVWLTRSAFPPTLPENQPDDLSLAGVPRAVRPPGDFIMGDASVPFTVFSLRIEDYPSMGFERILCEEGSTVVPRRP